MAPVYSTRLGLAKSVFLAPVTLFTVPAGFVAVVKDCEMSVGITTGGFTLALVHQPSGVFLLQNSESGLVAAPITYVSTQLHIVLYEGEQLVAQATSVTADFTVGGYLLSSP